VSGRSRGARALLIVFGPAAALLRASAAALVLLPHPVPKNATPAQRLYLTYCAECHGANGHGSWRATLFLVRPGDLTDGRLGQRSDLYLFDLIKHGGAPIGKPGMPAFGYHLSDDQIRALIGHLRQMTAPPKPGG
jgi:mono/diheme cytochrome c family protein